MSRSEKLDEYSLETVENYRENGDVVKASLIAGIVLGYPLDPLTRYEISEISKNSAQRAVLACLARIYVDSNKTYGNQAVVPSRILDRFYSASLVIRDVYHNADFRMAIDPVECDHKGRQHHFGPEMMRDEAKVLIGSYVLFSGDKSRELLARGLRLLDETYDRLPDNHPTKPLVGIERQLARISLDKKFEKEELLHDFDLLVANDELSNPNRVATAASWLVVWGERIDDQNIAERGKIVFARIVQNNPKWAFMIENEKKKLAIQKVRRRALAILTPITTSNNQRQELYSSLTG